MLRLTSNEKAVVGGLVTALFAVDVQVQQSGQFTLKEFLVALVGYAFTHATVWLTTNTPKVG